MKKKNIEVFLIFFLSLLITFLRLPTILRPFDVAYENFMAFWGREVVRGGGFYATPWTFKPPGEAIIYGLIYLWLGVANWTLGIRIFSLVIGIFIAVLIFKLGKRLFGFWAGFIASFIYIVFSSRIDVFPGILAYAEMWMPFFSLGGYLFYFLFLERKKTWLLFLSGLSLGISFCFKQSALYDFLPLFVFNFFQSYFVFKEKKENLREISFKMVIFLLGFIFPLGLFCFYMFITHRFSLVWDWMFAKTALYSKIREQHPGAYLKTIFKKTYPVSILAILAILVSFFRRQGKRFLFILWFVSTFFIFISSGKFWYYYFNQPFIPFCFLAGIFAQDLISWIRGKWGELLTILIILIMVFFNKNYYLFHLRNYFNFLSGKIEHDVYLASTSEGQAWRDRKDMADFIKKNVKPSEKIFIFEPSLSIQVMTDRFPLYPGFIYKQQLFENKVIGFAFMNSWETVAKNRLKLMENLQNASPDFIFLSIDDISNVFSEIRSFPEFYAFVFRYYEIEKRINELWLFKKKEGLSNKLISPQEFFMDWQFAESYFKVKEVNKNYFLQPLSGEPGTIRAQMLGHKTVNFSALSVKDFGLSNRDLVSYPTYKPSGQKDLLVTIIKPSKPIKLATVSNENFLWVYPPNGLNFVIQVVEEGEFVQLFFEPPTQIRKGNYDLYLLLDDNSVLSTTTQWIP